MIDPHNLGTFNSFEEVWDLYPSGGCPGDYVTVSGIVVRWNEGQRLWGDPKTFQQNIKYEKIEGSVEITENFKVDGELSGKKAVFDEIEVGNLKVSNIDLFKGKDSYSVALSSYDSVVAVDSYGRVDSSIYDIINIIAENEAVVSVSNQIVATKYKIQTVIQAYKGSTKLVYDTVIGPGKYIVSITANGCKYSIYDGIITITEVSQDKATLAISINCENVSTFTKTFTLTRIYGEKGLDGTDIQMRFKLSTVANVEAPISKDLDDYTPEGWTINPTGTNEAYRYEFVTKRLKVSGVWGAFSEPSLFSKWASDGKDGISPYFLNLTNDSVTLPADKYGEVTNYDNSVSTVQLYHGLNLVENADFSIDDFTSGISAILENNSLRVTSMPDAINSGIIKIGAYISNVLVGTIIYSISKALAGSDGSPSKVYKLDLSSAVIKKDKKGAFDVSTLTATAYCIIGNELPVIDNTLYICYKRSGDNDWIEYSSPINIVEGTTSIEVSLYNIAGGTLLDSERIPVVIDGVDGKDGDNYEYIFLLSETYTIPDTPVTSQVNDYVPEGWMDDSKSVTETLRYEFISKRTKINGAWGDFSKPSLWSVYSLDGKDSYSVGLSSYEATVAVDSKGRIDSSVYDIVNIVSGLEAVYTGVNQVVTTKYKVQTKISASRGTTVLNYSTEVGAGKYTVAITATGCKCVIADGVITITEISEAKGVLDITVNCEGAVSFNKIFTITRVSDGLDASTLFPWLDEWNNNKTLIGDENIVSIKSFFGSKDPTTGLLTGIIQGKDCITIDGVKRTGIFAIVDGAVVFELDPITKRYIFNGTVNSTGGIFKGSLSTPFSTDYTTTLVEGTRYRATLSLKDKFNYRLNPETEGMLDVHLPNNKELNGTECNLLCIINNNGTTVNIYPDAGGGGDSTDYIFYYNVGGIMKTCSSVTIGWSQRIILVRLKALSLTDECVHWWIENPIECGLS